MSAALRLAAPVAFALGCTGGGGIVAVDGGAGGDARIAPDGAVADAALAVDAELAVDAAPGDDAGSTNDAGLALDAAAPTDAGEALSRCSEDEGRVVCPRNTTRLVAAGIGRDVHWQLPLGAAPEAGWPSVILFQGSLFAAGFAWVGAPGAPFGAEHQAALIRALLDAGFAVLTPEVRGEGSTYWDTNVAPWNVAWDSSPDHALMRDLFAEMEAGRFGPLDLGRLYATGISSGGYMTSRMAVSYRGRFRALAIQSGSYATCAGAACVVPALPEDHPPTLFLHGALDAIVPEAPMRPYARALDELGVPNEVRVDPAVDHAWLPEAPARVTAFFRAH